MLKAIFRFHAELNDFLPKEKRSADIFVAFSGHETVKHLLESMGVPHTEVDVILVNDASVGFPTRIKDGDRVDIYPASQILVETPEIRLQPAHFDGPSFVLDGHLGRLATYLRLLGFDALYRNDYDDEEIAEISSNQDRILLTRDRGLLKRSQVRYGYCVRSKSPKEQVIEVLRRFNLAEQAKLFSRCARCNGSLRPVVKTEVFDRLEPKTKLYYDDFRVCQKCDQIYWKGSHVARMESELQDLITLSKSC